MFGFYAYGEAPYGVWNGPEPVYYVAPELTLQPTISDRRLLTTNRAYDIPSTDKKAPLSITLEQIDMAVLEHVQIHIKPTVLVDGNQKEVPVMYASPEKWKSIQKDGYIRDSNSDKIQTPLFLIRRVGISKGSLANASNKHLNVSFDPGWNKRNIYDRFAVQNNIIPSRKIHQTIYPDYVDLSYTGVIWTDSVSQLNAVIEQINVETDEYWGPYQGFKFRTNIDDYSIQTDVPADNDRIVRAIFTLNVNAYLLPEKLVSQYRTVSSNIERYTAKKVVQIVEII